MRRKALVSLICLAGLGGGGAVAQETAPGPQFSSIVDLAETLGEAHAIRSICNGDNDQTWRNYMQSLLDTEAAGGGQRRSMLTSAFNRGYRTQSNQHKTCTPDLREVEVGIAAHGRVLAEAIARSYLQ